MADTKISALTALVAGDIQHTSDVVAIVDTSVTTTKKATAQAVVNAVLAQNTDTTVTGTINQTTIPTSKTLLVSTDIGSTVQGYDATTLKSADIGVTVQGYDAQLADVAGLAVTDGNFIVGNGTNFVAESGATARTSLGLGTGDSPEFTAVNIGSATDTTITRSSAGVIAVEGSNVLMASNIGTTVQGYDADTAKLDVAQTFTAAQTFNNPTVFSAGTASLPSITFTGDTNTGIFSPAADTIAFAEGGAEAMRINSSGNVGIACTDPVAKLDVRGILAVSNSAASYWGIDRNDSDGSLTFADGTTERARIDSSGNVGIGVTPSAWSTANSVRAVQLNSGSFWTYSNSAIFLSQGLYFNGTNRIYTVTGEAIAEYGINSGVHIWSTASSGTSGNTATLTERARITSGGDLLVGKTSTTFGTAGGYISSLGQGVFTVSNDQVLALNRITNDGKLIGFHQDGTEEGNISVSGNTVSYNAFTGGHWTQLQEGRGYNPDIPRGTVMSSIGEMSVWKSVIWTETTEHPAVPAVDAVEAVLDEEGNVVEPAIEAVEGKDAWTESSTHREFYLGNLDIGATFEEDGFTKTVVDDGNERLPKVKISNVVGDKAVYGVFQTWDEAQDMLITSLGAFVVRIAAGVTVQIGDLLESNGDGCAKVQDDDVIRSKTIGKVTSTVATATYDDGSYTVPCVIYCG